MPVFVAWVSEEPEEELVGPWRQVVRAAPGLLLVYSDDTLSRVFHEIKWALPDGAAVFVAPVAQTPKLRGLSPGKLAWLRERSGPVRR